MPKRKSCIPPFKTEKGEIIKWTKETKTERNQIIHPDSRCNCVRKAPSTGSVSVRDYQHLRSIKYSEPTKEKKNKRHNAKETPFISPIHKVRNFFFKPQPRPTSLER